jgi:hypothetical protein
MRRGQMKYFPLVLLMSGISFLLTRKKPIVEECGYHIISDYNGRVTFALTDPQGDIIDIMVTDNFWEVAE